MRPGRTEPKASAGRSGRKAELPLSSAALAGLAREILRKGCDFRFQALGGSMHPFVKDGDILTVSPATADALNVGDVAAVILPGSGKLVVHRVRRVTASRVVIRGDNAPAADEPIPRTRVLGRVTRIERDGRRVSLGLGPGRRFVPGLAGLKGRRWLRPVLKAVRVLIKP